MRENQLKKQSNTRARKDIINILISLVTIFSVMVTCYVSVSLFVYDQFNIHFYYLILIGIISLIASLLISLFVKINKISLIGQVSVVYSSIALCCLGLVVFMNSKLVELPMFWYVTFISSFFGLAVLVVVLIIFKRHEERKLNAVLNKYKGRNSDEK